MNTAEDKLEIVAGKNYLTRNGTHASVYQWDEERKCWRGTVRGGGMNDWHEDGRDLYGTSAWDIVAEEKEP